MAKLRIFSAIPRNPDDPRAHIDSLVRVAGFGDQHGFAGTLLFTSNDTPVDPWAMAQHLMAQTRHCSPLIAVNPAYAHPFAVAKMVSSLGQLCRRKVYLNMITGAAIGDLAALGDLNPHDARYARLSEFIRIVRGLLGSPRPLSFKGRFYTTDNLQLRPSLPPDLMPEFLIAGQSDDARRVAGETDALMMQMLPDDLEQGIRSPGVNLGIFARADRQQAIRDAERRFQDSAEARQLLAFSMDNTDSSWKRQLAASGGNGEIHDNGYWLLPFLTYQADCPYLVGSYQEIGAHLRRFADLGVTTMILDMVADDEEFVHIAEALASSGVV
jgi:alkanesulfonate monooxygenase